MLDLDRHGELLGFHSLVFSYSAADVDIEATAKATVKRSGAGEGSDQARRLTNAEPLGPSLNAAEGEGESDAGLISPDGGFREFSPARPLQISLAGDCLSCKRRI